LPSDRPSAVIFDLDGVLLDSAESHRRSWYILAEELNLSLCDAFFWETFGQTNPTILRRLLGRELDPAETQRLSERKEAHFRAVARGAMTLFPGVEGVLAALKAHGFRLGAGTSAPRSNVEFFFNELGLGRFFEACVAMEDIRHGKPDPEVFLKVAEKLGVPPARCLVVEDALAGVAAAKAAGMKCIAIATTNSAEALREKARPDLVLARTAEITPAMVDELLAKR
jgi:beta-phosphoglucomutase family hydrolase